MLRAAAAGLLLFAAYEYYRQSQENQDTGYDFGAEWGLGIGNVFGQVTDYVEGVLVSTDKMKNVTPEYLKNKNVQAFLRMIRVGEGTSDEAGYRRIFGGQLFDNGFKDHPRILVKKSGYNSTAAGAYQFIVKTWDYTKKTMGLPDFSPASQDLGAVGLIAYRQALGDVLAGRFESAVRKCGWEWASLPGSQHGQPTVTMARAKQEYERWGGRYETV